MLPPPAHRGAPLAYIRHAFTTIHMHSSAAGSQASLPGLFDLLAPLSAGHPGSGMSCAELAPPRQMPSDFDDRLDGLLAAASWSAPTPGARTCRPPAMHDAVAMTDVAAHPSAAMDSFALTSSPDEQAAIVSPALAARSNHVPLSGPPDAVPPSTESDTSYVAAPAESELVSGRRAPTPEPLPITVNHECLPPVGSAQHAALLRYFEAQPQSALSAESAASIAAEPAATGPSITESHVAIGSEPIRPSRQRAVPNVELMSFASPVIAAPAAAAIAAADARLPPGLATAARTADSRPAESMTSANVPAVDAIGAPSEDAPGEAATMPSQANDAFAAAYDAGDVAPAAEIISQDANPEVTVRDADVSGQSPALSGHAAGSDRGQSVRPASLAAESALMPAAAESVPVVRVLTPQSPASDSTQTTVGDKATDEMRVPGLGESSPVAMSAQAPGSEGPAGSAVRQISQAVEMWRGSLAEQGSARFAAWLSPPDLGHVWVELTRTAEGITARLSASDDSVQSLLETQAPELRQALADSGIDVAALDLSGRSGGNSNFDRQPSPERPAEEEVRTAARFTPHLRPRAAPRAGAIDVRA